MSIPTFKRIPSDGEFMGLEALRDTTADAWPILLQAAPSPGTVVGIRVTHEGGNIVFAHYLADGRDKDSALEFVWEPDMTQDKAFTILVFQLAEEAIRSTALRAQFMADLEAGRLPSVLARVAEDVT